MLILFLQGAEHLQKNIAKDVELVQNSAKQRPSFVKAVSKGCISWLTQHFSKRLAIFNEPVNIEVNFRCSRVQEEEEYRHERNKGLT